jgi:hypothetical protein
VDPDAIDIGETTNEQDVDNDVVLVDVREGVVE